MSEAIARLFEQAVAEACGPAMVRAREEGFAAGMAEGRAAATRDARVRLNQMLVDLAAVPLGDGALLGNADGVGAVPAVERDTTAGVAGCAQPVRPPTEAGRMSPVMAAEKDAGQDTGARNAPSVPPVPEPIEVPLNTGGEDAALPEGGLNAGRPPALPEPSPAQPDEGSLPTFPAEKGDAASPHPVLAVERLAERASSPAFPWRTEARGAVLDSEYPAGVSMAELRRKMEALPGEALPRGNEPLWRWVTGRKLKRRAEVKTEVAAPPGGAPEAKEAPNAEDAADVEEANEAPAASPQDAPRETPQLKRALELVAQLVHPNDVKAAVRLSAEEFALVQKAWTTRQRGAA